jgi:hypothetical protein
MGPTCRLLLPSHSNNDITSPHPFQPAYVSAPNSPTTAPPLAPPGSTSHGRYRWNTVVWWGATPVGVGELCQKVAAGGGYSRWRACLFELQLFKKVLQAFAAGKLTSLESYCRPFENLAFLMNYVSRSCKVSILHFSDEFRTEATKALFFLFLSFIF